MTAQSAQTDTTAGPGPTRPLSLKAHFAAVAALRDSIAERQEQARKTGLTVSTADDVAKLNGLVQKTRTSAAYDARQADILARFNKEVAAIPGLARIIRTWPLMHRDDRLHFLKRCVKILANIQSEDKLKVPPATIKIETAETMGTATGIARSYKDKMMGAFTIMSIRDDVVKDIGDSIDTVVHEQTHAYQTILRVAVSNDRIDSNHPLYADGEMFLALLQAAYIPGEIDKTAYRTQCTEMDAYRAGTAAQDFMVATAKDVVRALDRSNPLTEAATLLADLACLATTRVSRLIGRTPGDP